MRKFTFTNYLSLFAFLFLGLIQNSKINAQCLGAAYTTGTVAHNGTITTIGSTYAGEYNTFTLTGAVTGDIYRFSSSVATDFITVTTTANVVLAQGVSPITYTQPASVSGSVRFHVHKDAACATESVSRIQSVNLVIPPCPAPTAQPTALSLIANSGGVSGSFTAASPTASNYLVIRTTTSTAPNAPVNETNYTVGASVLGGVVVANGTSTSFASTGLTVSTQYYFWVYSFNSGACSNTYFTSSPLSGSVTTTNTSQNIVSTTTGGLWSSPTTWVGNLVPSALDNATIVDGATVTIDVSPIVNNLTIGQGVSGVLNFDATTGRTLQVNGNLTTNVGSTFTPFNGTTGRALTVNGNVVLNGSADFTKASTSLVLSGTTPQTISGSGDLGVGSPIRLLAVSNLAGATISRPLTITSTFNIVQGSINNGTNVTMDNTVGGVSTTSCAIQRGIGSLTNPIQIGGTATFNLAYIVFSGTINTAIVAGNEIPSSGSINAITMNNTLGVTLNQNITLAAASSALTFTSGILTVNPANRIVCSNASYNGTAGGVSSFVSGKVGLTWGTSATKTYPIGSVGQLRTVITTASIGSGVVAFSIQNPSGGVSGSGISALTGTRRWYGEVLSGSITSYSSISIAYGTDDGFGTATNAVKKIAQASTLAGTYNSLGPVTGTATPLVSTTGTYSTLDYFALGISSGSLPISWDGGAGTSNWGDANNWSNDIVPTSSSDLIITGSTTINVNVNAEAAVLTIGAGVTLNLNANALTIAGTAAGNGLSNSGIMNLGGGTLTVGPIGGGNRNFTNNGTLTVTSGSLIVNGNLALGDGSTFNMSGGDITLDPNDGTAGGSLSSSTPIMALGATTALSTSNVTGGTILINDPHFTGNGYAFIINTNTSTTWLGNTIQFGGSTNTHPSTATNGFRVDCYFNSGRMAFGNVIVNGNDPAKFVSDVSFGINALGTLTVNSGSELRLATSLSSFAGNIVNNGTITTTGTGFSLQKITGISSTVVPNTTPQSIGGTGVYRNATSGATASLTSLVVNNTSSGGVTLNVPLSVSSTLTLTNGVVNTSSVNLLTVGVSPTATGTLSYTSGRIAGPYKKFVGASTGTTLLPIGTTTVYNPANINFTTAPTTGGSLTAQFVATNPGNGGLPITDGADVINTINTTGFWRIDAGDGLTGGTYSVAIKGAGFAGVNTPADLRVVKRPTSGTTWTVDGTHVAGGADSTANRSGCTGFSEFTIAGISTANPLPVSITSFKGERKGAENLLSWTTATEINNAGFELQRSADGVNFSTLTFVESKANNGNSSAALTYNYADVKPLSGSGYYRLKQIDRDGKSAFSEVVLIKGLKPTKLELVSVYPNPVINTIKVSIAAAKADKITFIVSDITGKAIISKVMNVTSGDNTVQIDVNNLANGTYTIKAICADGCETTIKKFVKQ